ncbi:E3 ubiquitin-protein ligase Rnf220-like isoform X2 [Adelges cooleyi]|uniref:E3 ubiquitin-protein ligase Rnf220-like isoform X2 n=1 Tax=Adelges cooleyi TaxID=133065 RepID=UPI00218097FE|nr:E3 ubiquitin-protein ligase Rnf220-like isoform X2 [Adelges cooleyi]
MEHSPYSQSPSPSPSLVNFPSPANLPDIRLHRPFSQMHDLKHLHLPFQGSNFGFRFMENYSALPAHLLHHLQPQFLHPALDPRISFSQATGVFQPLGSPNPHHQHPTVAHHPAIKGFASAFAPPAKCYKIDDGKATITHADGVATQQQQQHHQQNQQLSTFPYPRRSPCSPASMSASPTSVQQQNAAAAGKEECSDRDTPSSGAVSEDGRTIRRKKATVPPTVTVKPQQLQHQSQQQQAQQSSLQQQQQQQQQPCCPVCSVSLRPQDLESHFLYELERLYKASTNRRHRRTGSDKDFKDQTREGGGGGTSLSPGREASLHGRWETYQKVKANRHNRLRIKNRKRKPDDVCCPVCNDPMPGTQEQINLHVEMCLRNKGHPASNEDENVDVEGDSEMYDVYGWTNRMRQPSMLVHGYNRGVPIVNCNPRQSTADDEDAVLVVDDNGEDEIYKYGPNQYAEQDIIPPPTSESQLTPEQNDSNAMEMTAEFCENTSGPLDVSIKKELSPEDGSQQTKPKMDVEKYQFNNNNQIVEALKARIRELELVSKNSDKFTCLLCKGNFKDPVVSTSCWHVYCEVCWLQILGSKKLCPQCYVITLPSNLRRVYL